LSMITPLRPMIFGWYFGSTNTSSWKLRRAWKSWNGRHYNEKSK
jgi:hypothetical protein